MNSANTEWWWKSLARVANLVLHSQILKSKPPPPVHLGKFLKMFISNIFWSYWPIGLGGGSSLSSCLIWSSWSKCSWPRWSSWSRWSYGLDGHHGQDRQDRGDRQDRQSLKARQDITHIFAGGVLKDLQNRYDCHWVHPVHCIFLVNKKISFITFIFSKKLWSGTLYYIVCIWYLIDSKWFLF